ncbi:DUF11 domain-containing protein [Clostridium sp. AL.422]|uniref:DUF11 domain-containing protein n=1 Tax=Clostridium TaxID=1485 RepID=UPI00293DC9CF|nr:MULTISPECIES: DUF11 domain-containing protein [unclassified Clostridium]MDV4152136.1 DUF11 domain-containing protein [Clostridium sp. AL.422]
MTIGERFSVVMNVADPLNLTDSGSEEGVQLLADGVQGYAKDTNIIATNEAKYFVIKSVDKTYAQVNDYLIYTTTIQNIGNVNLTNISFADFIGTFLEFIEGTVYINWINYQAYNPSNQFQVPDMHPGDITTIVFAVKIREYSKVGYIANTSEVTLAFKQSPDSPIITKTIYSNEIRTYIPVAKIDLVESVDKEYAVVNDILTYSFTATNNGNSTVINTFFTDFLPQEVCLVSGSVIVNGVSGPNYNPQNGFTLGTIYIGQIVNLEFKVKVNSLPKPNTIKNSVSLSYSYCVDQAEQPISKTVNSNTVTTIINSYSANLTKAVNKSYATIGDVLDYTIIATNTGTVTLSSINLVDILPSGVTFVNGSVVLDGVSKSDFNPNSGFLINDVLPDKNVVVMFKATVTSPPTLPQIINKANITFKYQLIPALPYMDGVLTSNIVRTSIRSSNIIT